MHQIKIPAALFLALAGATAGNGAQADCGTPATLPAGQYAQVGLPCAPEDPTVQGVFGDDLAPAQYGTNWVVYRYDPATNANVLLGLSDPMSQDEGYWVWSRNAATWDVDGDPTPLIAGDPGALCPSPAGCYPIPLTLPSGGAYYQWNMLGLPIPDTTAWADVRIVTEDTIYTPAEAQAAGVTYDLFQRWNGSGYETGNSAGGDELNAHEGFYAATMAPPAVAAVGPAVVAPAPPELWVPKPFTPGALNDTGIGFGGNDPSGNNADCSGTEIDQQDCAHGRDAAAAAGTLVKVGGGAAGFDFTRLGADGTPLATQDGTWSDAGDEIFGTQWSCVLDHVTGLWWEVKTNDDGLRDKDWRYTSYDSAYADDNDNSSDGGDDGVWAGPVDTGNGSFSDNCANALGICTTEQYVADVNTAGLCGKSDWRMPTIDELISIRHLGTFIPAIDTAYFPNTVSSSYWSASPYAANANFAWSLVFYVGSDSAASRFSYYQVRLVRAGQ